MTTPADDLADPHTVLQALLDDDRAVRDAFARALEPELNQLADALATCFEHWHPIRQAAAARAEPRTDLVNGFVHGVLDDIVVSTKLLLAGKAAASGNIARQAIEGLAMAVLCSADQEVILRARERQGDVRGRYWERVMDPIDRLVEGQRAVQQLAWNADQLRLPRPWIDRLSDAQKLFSAASHAGPLTIAYRTHLGLADAVSIGGHFDAGKLASYRTGLTLRTFMARDLASVMPFLLAALGPGAVAA
ncbi:hypothetical protein [Burkholderia cenocepacia]|uniref:hypothetical protein n=1 Tax=Burkholderia cenocepacia TaxID=95486 RepID=UPI002ABD9D22|nr:hypothetical protein [Burkholderia cenocepacia]